MSNGVKQCQTVPNGVKRWNYIGSMFDHMFTHLVNSLRYCHGKDKMKQDKITQYDVKGLNMVKRGQTRSNSVIQVNWVKPHQSGSNHVIPGRGMSHKVNPG